MGEADVLSRGAARGGPAAVVDRGSWAGRAWVVRSYGRKSCDRGTCGGEPVFAGSRHGRDGTLDSVPDPGVKRAARRRVACPSSAPPVTVPSTPAFPSPTAAPPFLTIGTLLALDDGPDRKAIRAVARHRLDDLARRIDDLQRMQGVLAHLVDACAATGRARPCPIIAALSSDDAAGTGRAAHRVAPGRRR